MLNAGRGFNDVFEEQIGLQAESKFLLIKLVLGEQILLLITFVAFFFSKTCKLRLNVNCSALQCRF